MKRLALSAVLSAILGSAVAAQTAPAPGTADYDRWVGQQLVQLQRLADRDAIRQLMYHYGRGNDQLSAHYADRQKGGTLATAEYQRAFTPDMQITVFPLRGTTPLRQVKGIADWIAFAGGFFDQAKYSSTLHLMSNFTVDVVDASTARGTAYAHVPHYIQSAAKDPTGANVTVENMLARYEFAARRQQNGEWRIAEMTIYLDEIQRQTGFFPNGQAPGK
jgi:hypothetical protein